MILTKFFIFLM